MARRKEILLLTRYCVSCGGINTRNKIGGLEHGPEKLTRSAMAIQEYANTAELENETTND